MFLSKLSSIFFHSKEVQTEGCPADENNDAHNASVGEFDDGPADEIDDAMNVSDDGPVEENDAMNALAGEEEDGSIDESIDSSSVWKPEVGAMLGLSICDFTTNLTAFSCREHFCAVVESAKYFGTKTTGDAPRSLDGFAEGEKIVKMKQWRCQPNRRSSTASRCTWRIRVAFSATDNCYRVTNFDPVHSCTRNESIDPHYAWKMSQLTADELNAIRLAAEAGAPGVRIRKMLQREFRGRVFDPTLIDRVMRDCKHRLVGKGSVAMGKLFEIGASYSKNGGLFEVWGDDSGTLSRVMLQHTVMRSFVDAYQDCIQIDGTENTNRYGHTLQLFTGVDSLWMTCIFGYTISPSEESSTVLEALKKFGVVESAHNTLITDEGAAYERVGNIVAQNHVNCAKHATADALKVSGLGASSSQLRRSFLQDVNYLLYRSSDCTDLDAFVTRFDQIRSDYIQHDSAHSFLRKLYKKKHKMIAFFTRQFFTAGSYTSQRIEGMNSIVKGNGKPVNSRIVFGF